MSSYIYQLDFKSRRLVLAGLIEVHGDNHQLERVARELTASGISVNPGMLRTYWRRVKLTLTKGDDPVLAELVREILVEKKAQ
jgi:hypothetical protein